MSFSIMRVLERAFSPLGQNPAVFLGVAFIFGGLAGVIGLALQNFAIKDAANGLSNPGVFFAGYLGSIVIKVIGSSLTQAALVYAAMKSFKGEKAGLGESISKALPHLLPVVAISILFSLGVVVGSLALVVPGVILAIMWSVSVPARVVENKGIFEAFGRSRALTKGSRWSIFGLLVITWLLSMAIGAVIGVLGVFAGKSLTEPGFVTPFSPVMIIITLISNSVLGGIYAAGLAGIYYELRTVKEGSMIDEIVDVFA